jgi:hypothetical protein
MRNTIYIFIVFIIGIFLAGDYFADVSFAEETTAFQKSEDVVVISNPKTPELNMRIVFKEELSIGEAEGDENYMFGSVILFNTDNDGNFFVADYDKQRILKYDPDGKYLLTFGREGQGPGEFRSLSIPRFDKDNNLYITDSLNRRISIFDKNCEYVKQMKFKERYNDVYINSKGLLIATQWNMFPDSGVMKMNYVYGLFDDSFNLIAELYKSESEFPSPAGTDESSLAKSLAKTLSRSAFRPQIGYTVASNDFIYLGYSDTYEIRVYSPEGKLVKKITRDYDPIPVSKKDKERYAQMSLDRMTSPIFTEGIKNKVIPLIKYPKYKAAYLRFTPMENGWLAVLVDFIQDEYMLFDIFDQEGQYISHFKTPVPDKGLYMARLFFKNGKAYAVATEDDYMFVKRYSFEIQEYTDGKWVRKK